VKRIHPSSVVDPGAELGDGVEIGPFCTVGPHVRLGEGVVLHSHAVIAGHTEIARETQVFPFASLGEPPQDVKYKGEPTRLEIGDRNVFRECCTVHRGTTHDQGVTRVGSDGLFMAYTHVAHDCEIGDNVVLANCASMAGHVQIGDWVQLGGLCAIHQFVKIGAHAFVAGGAMVRQDVPPFIMVAGYPAEPQAVNAEGLKRRGFTAEQIRHIRDAYRILYRSELKLTDALEQLRALVPAQPEIRDFVAFIEGSTRSLVR